MTEEKTELDISVEDVGNAVVEITKMDVVIAGLYEKYEKMIFDVTTTEGMKNAKEARQEIREPRYLIENLRKDGKKPILELGRKLDQRANDMKEKLLSIENPIHAVIKEEEGRIERERQEKIDAERNRVAAIEEKIAWMRKKTESCALPGISAEGIAGSIEEVEAFVVDDSFDEFKEQAEDAKLATLTKLRAFHEAAVQREAADAELTRLRAAQAERDAEDRAEREAKEQAEREAREAKQKKERERLARQRKRQEAEARRLKEEREALKKKRAAQEQRDREEQAARAAAEEAARKAKYPGEEAIVYALATYFGVTSEVAAKWIETLKTAE